MLHKVSRLRGLDVHATDGDIGTVSDLYFDAERWTVRYLVVSTGSWLGRRVLVSPMAVEQSWTAEGVRVKLTQEQVRRSPDADEHEPISRQQETALLRHYGHPFYWGGGSIWGAYDYPGALLGAPPEPVAAPVPARDADAARAPRTDRHLRSTSEVTGYHILASDGEIGHVDDFLIDDRTWQIRYLQLDTSNWIGGKAVAIAPRALRGVDLSNGTVKVTLTREQIKQSPPLDALDLDPAETAPPFVVI